MATPGGPESQSGAYVVTRPNPGVVGTNRDGRSSSSAELLQQSSRHRMKYFPFSSLGGPESRKVLLQSFTDMDKIGATLVVPYKNGFVEGIIRAFQQDLHLVLRPDDVWLAIMVQFSFYVNGHSEEMREYFVTHGGKKQLVVHTGEVSPLSVDFSVIAEAFKDLIQENLVDPDLTSWILPNFSTTTSEDIATASIVMMATTKAYFEYSMMGGCGFPSVTLLGERADWVKLLDKVAKLATYGEEVADWGVLLTKVVGKMIETFDQPDSQTTKDFWMRAVHQAGESGSGSLKTLSGWITAFCHWDEEGRIIDNISDATIAGYANRWGRHIDRKRFVIDDVPFPMISPSQVPQAVADVPVKILDFSSGICYETTAIAGLVGVMATASRGETFDADTVQPRSGYWVLVDKAGPIPADLNLREGHDMKRI